MVKRAQPAADHPPAAVPAAHDPEQGYATLCRILDLLGHVTAQDTVDDICRAIVEGVRTFLGFDRAGLHLWYEPEGIFRGTFGTDIEGRTTDEHSLWWRGEGWGPMEKIKRGDIFLVEKLDQPLARPGEEGQQAHLVILRFEEKVYGILSVDNRITGRPISESELRYLPLFSRIVGNAVEITRARSALALSEERFRQVAEHSREWIWELDGEGRYAYCSPVARQILGRDPEAFLGRPAVDFVTAEDRPAVEEAFRQAIQAGHPIHDLLNRQVCADGRVVALETSGLLLRDDQGRPRGFRGLHRDVTLELAREDQLRQAQKMEAIGRLAGGVAHYFNNLLTVILGCGCLMLDALDENDPIREELEQIRKAGEEAASLTRQLLAFSRKQLLVVQTLDVNAVLAEVEILLKSTLGREIELVLRPAPEVWKVRADADQIKHVVVRLALNGRAAIEQAVQKERAQNIEPRPVHGITIETANVVLDEARCRKRENVTPGRYVMLALHDTGVGISDEIMQHIFEPFFTTKNVGEGPGLGLSSVYGAMKQMNGDVEVETSRGKGTTFRLYFPAIGDPVRDTRPA